MTPRPPHNDDDHDDITGDALGQSLAELRAAAVPDGPPPAVVANTLAALQEAAGSDPAHFNIRRNKTMRHLTRIAAALVLIAGTAAMLFLAGRTSSVALADVVQKVRDAKTLTYTMTSTAEDTGQSQTIKFLQLGDGRQRTEFAGGTISIIDPRAGKTLLLNTQAKTATVGEFQGPADGLRFDPVDHLRKLRAAGAKDLGVKDVAGRKLQGFASVNDTPPFTVWADAQTGLPVTVELTLPVAGAFAKVVMTDFVVDAPLDESLFSVAVPAGYKSGNQEGVRMATVVAQEVNPERHVIEALRGYARLDNGKFPAKFNDWGAYATRLGDGRQTNDDDFRLMGHVGAITPFLVSLPRDAWAYTGAGKTQADKDAVLFWYRKPDGTHRAIYGDLTVKTVKPEDLPPTPQPRPANAPDHSPAK